MPSFGADSSDFTAMSSSQHRRGCGGHGASTIILCTLLVTVAAVTVVIESVSRPTATCHSGRLFLYHICVHVLPYASLASMRF